jgi:hypothetical protein
MLPQNIDISAGIDGTMEDYRLSKTAPDEYDVYLGEETPLFKLRRQQNGTWYQSLGEPVLAGIVQQLGDNLNDLDQQEFLFPIVFHGEAAICRVAIGESGFSVLMDDRFIAEVNMDDEGINWVVVNGEPIDEDTLYEIGKQIEHHTA